MATNKQIAENVLKAVGGKPNVTHVTHCITRLRFTLKDESLPKDEEIKKISGVIGVVRAGGQYQIIIGQNVPKVYAELCEIGGFQAAAPVQEDPDAVKQPLTPKQVGLNIMNYLSGAMVPLIPVMVAGAMFKTLQVLLGPDMLGVISAEGDFYLLCTMIYNAFYYFLPVYLGFTAAKKLGASQMLGVMCAAMLLVPEFVALANEGASFTVYGIPAPTNSYGQTVLPVVLAVFAMSYVERFFKKIIPDILSNIFVPFLTMVIMVPLTFCLLAPIGSWAGAVVGNGLIAFGNFGGFLAVAIVAALWEFLVMTGMHQVLIVFGITTMMQTGCDKFVLTAGGYATWAAFGMALGAFLRIRDKEEKALSLGYFISGILGGVTEPVLYGIGLKYKRPFIALIIGGFCGGLYAGLMGVGTYVMGATNFLAVLGYVSGGTGNMIHGCIGCVISLGLTAALTYFFGFDKNEPVVQKQ